MPGYGIAGPDEGTGLLPWAWAMQRLSRSHDYWVATVRPDGRPHVMPVWGVWRHDAVWFSSSRASRKVRNLAGNPRCTVTTDNPLEPVVLDGTARFVEDRDGIREFADAVNAKYDTDYGIESFAGDANCVLQVAPESVFGLDTSDFTGTPTRWRPTGEREE
jgi:PPOX class probable F420-dependent enzyme